MTKPLVSVIIPVFNEEATIEAVLRRAAAEDLKGWEKEIIVVDDGSTDNSKLKTLNFKQECQTQHCVLAAHEKNQGKGAAIRTGLEHATGEYVLIQDADLEYDPADWPALLAAAEKNPGAVIYGSRNLNPGRQGYRHYVWGVWLLTKFTNLLFGSTLTDVYTGYKLIPAAAFKTLSLASVGFEFEAEVTAQLLKKGVAIKEVPIRYCPRKFSEGKKIRWRDGLVGFWTIVRRRFSSKC